MGDKSRGLYAKFYVGRTDGSSEVGGKHYGCDYFVLDLTHDKYSVPALKAYADSCKTEYPLLARDLENRVRLIEAIRDADKTGWQIDEPDK